MFPDSPFAVPRGSFQRPVKTPGVSPFDDPLIWVGFNAAWLSYIEGSLKQLLLQATWLVDSPAELSEVQQQTFTLLYIFSQFVDAAPKLGSAGADSEDIMIRQDPDNACLLQTSIDGINWCTFADLSKCVNFGSQPGSGTAQPSPGGGTQQGCYQLQANGKVLLPYVFNSGDVIELVSENGLGWDGGTILWSCPDGSEYFGGCIPGSGSPTGGDPLPSENHMALIVEIAGSYYSLQHGAFTLPGGISNAQATIQVNDSALSNNTGSYTICVKVTNNQPATWSHTFDYTKSTYGFTPQFPGTSGLWSAGVGWQGQTDLTHVGANSVVIVDLPFTATNLTDLEVFYTVVGEDSGAGCGVYAELSGTVQFSAVSTFPDCSAGSRDLTGSHAPISCNNLEVHVIAGNVVGSCPSGSSVVVTKLIVQGTGVDPF